MINHSTKSAFDMHLFVGSKRTLSGGLPVKWPTGNGFLD
jgi:hypothetical protein